MVCQCENIDVFICLEGATRNIVNPLYINSCNPYASYVWGDDIRYVEENYKDDGRDTAEELEGEVKIVPESK